MSKKILFTFLSFVVVATVLVGCGPSPEEISTMTASAWTPTSPPTHTPLPTNTPEPTSPPPTLRDDAGDVVIPAGRSIRIVVLDPVDMFQDAIIMGSVLAVEDFGKVQGFDIELVEIDDYCFKDTIDMRAAITDNDPTLFAAIGPSCSGNTEAALPILEEMRIVVVSPSANRLDLPDIGPNVFNRVIFDEEQIAATGIDEGALLQLDSVQEFLSRLAGMEGVSPESIAEYGIFYALSYDAATVLLEAIQNSAILQDDGSLVINWQSLAEAVRSTQGYEGVTGNITIDEHGNRVP